MKHRNQIRKNNGQYLDILSKRRFYVFSAVVFIIALVSSQTSSAASYTRIFNAQTGFTFESNLSHAADEYERHSDNAFTTSVSLGRAYQINPAVAISLAIDADNDIYTKFTSLNNDSIGVSLGLRYKYGVGPRVPVVRFKASATRIDSRESYTGGSLYQTSVQLSKRLSDTVDFQMGFTRDDRVSDNDVFHFNGNTLNAKIGFPLTTRARLSLGGGVRRGGIFVYDHDYWPPDSKWMWVDTFDYVSAVYRVRATTRIYNANLNLPVNEHTSIDFGVALTDSRWNDVKYPNRIYHACVLFSF